MRIFLFYFFRILGAPGVAVHEFAHLFFCLFARVKIYKVKLFQFGKTAGYVVHDEPKRFDQAFLISFGPLLINSLVTIFLFSFLREPYHWQQLFFLWFGLVVGLHAIPSTGDAKTLFQIANKRVWRNPLVLISYPLILILYILNFLKRWRIDILYVVFLFYLGRFYL